MAEPRRCSYVTYGSPAVERLLKCQDGRTRLLNWQQHLPLNVIKLDVESNLL